MTKSSSPKATGKKGRGTHRRSNSKHAAERARDTHQQTPLKVVAEKQLQRKRAPKVIAVEVGDTGRRIAAQFEEFRAQVPDTMRAVAERSVAQTREAYERSTHTLQSVLESWQKSFGAAGQGVVALNLKMIDVAERNINAGFNLATNLAGATNLAEVMELQAAYWRKLFGELKAQAEKKRLLSKKTRVGAGVERRNQ